MSDCQGQHIMVFSDGEGAERGWCANSFGMRRNWPFVIVNGWACLAEGREDQSLTDDYHNTMVSPSVSYLRNNAMKILGLRPIPVFALLCSLFSLPAFAQTDTTTFDVTIEIESSCSIDTPAATDVDFSTVASTATDVTATGQLN